MNFSRDFLLLFLIIFCLAFVSSGSTGAKPDVAQAEQKPGLQEESIAQAREILSQARHISQRLALLRHMRLNLETLLHAQPMLVSINLAAGNFAPPAPSKAGEIVCVDGVFLGKVGKGETFSEILEHTGSDNAQHYIHAASRVFSMKSFREGQPYKVITDPDTGKAIRFEYEIDGQRRLVVEGGEKPAARLEDIDYSCLLERVEATITDSLFQAVADIGENPQLALKISDLFGSEINFIRDIQAGDNFTALIEKRYRDGEYKGYGRILAARFSNKGKEWQAFLYRDQDNQLQYYNSNGENLEKTLLQAPLAITRVTSRFTNNRFHPILGKARPHHGVDYGAPTGTPVKAVGSGVVTYKGWAGGYGNQIIIKHAAGLESMYSHLSGFARGLADGQKIKQGQVIGYVGSTGLSTGPHLDFRLRQDGKYINPATVINPRAQAVVPGLMASFQKTRDQELSLLNGAPIPYDYTMGSIVPDAVEAAPTKATLAEKPARKAAKTRYERNRQKRLRALAAEKKRLRRNLKK